MRYITKKMILAVIVLLIKLFSVEGKVLQGHLVTDERFQYLDKFCAYYSGALISFDIEYESKEDYVSLLIYPASAWNDLYYRSDSLSCAQKVKLLTDGQYYERGSVIELSTEPQAVKTRGGYYGSQTTETKDPVCEFTERFESDEVTEPPTTTTTTASPTNKTNKYGIWGYQEATTTPKPKKLIRGRLRCRSTQPLKDDWRFFAFSSCNSSSGLNLTYKLTLTNDYNNEGWLRQFSREELYVLPTLIGFGAAYLGLLFAVVFLSGKLKREHVFHLDSLYLSSLVCQLIGIGIVISAYSVYAANGIGIPYLKMSGQAVEALSELLLTVMLLNFARGHHATKNGMGTAYKINLVFFTLIYAGTYAAVFLVQQFTFDPAQINFLYQSPAGYVLFAMRILASIMFMFTTFFAIVQNAGWRLFYLAFGIAFSAWFISGPCIVMIGNNMWRLERENDFAVMHHSWMFSGHAGFLILLALQFVPWSEGGKCLKNSASLKAIWNAIKAGLICVMGALLNLMGMEVVPKVKAEPLKKDELEEASLLESDVEGSREALHVPGNEGTKA